MSAPLSADCRVISTRSATALSRLHSACFEEGWSAEAFERLLAAPNVVALASLDDTGRHTGFVLLRHAADEAEIVTIAVLPPSRRSGIASALLEAATGILKEGGVGMLFLEVAEDNVEACAFYEAQGFRQVGSRPGYYRRAGGDPVTARVMKRTVASGP